MRVIFLDFDGVLNDYAWLAAAKEWFDARGLAWWAPSEEDSWRRINPARVALLNQIIERTGARVVISSSWRNAFKVLGALQHLLVKQGFVGRVIDRTPTLRGARGDEIRQWLVDAEERYDVESFVILDDDLDMGDLLPRLVRTGLETGLQPEHVDAAVALLERSLVLR